MYTLEKVCEENLSCYSEYKTAFNTELHQYQSRIYPSESAEKLCWYHIKVKDRYIGAAWLEKNPAETVAVLGIFIADRVFRNQGIGKSVIQQIIAKDLPYMETETAVLRVRAENHRAIACYERCGFREKTRYRKGQLDVVEMIYKR